jgi:hypothetical protein
MPTAINWEMNEKELRYRMNRYLASSGLNFNIKTTWKKELTQRVYRAGR